MEQHSSSKKQEEFEALITEAFDKINSDPSIVPSLDYENLYKLRDALFEKSGKTFSILANKAEQAIYLLPVEDGKSHVVIMDSKEKTIIR